MKSENMKMKSYIKYAVLALLSLVALMGAAHADPVTVEDVNIQNDNGDRIVLVTLANANPDSGIYSQLEFTIEELGTTKNMGVVTVNTNDTKVLTYNLREVTDSYDSLQRGETYQITTSTKDNSITESFLYGNEKETDGLELNIERVEINGNQLNDQDNLQVLNGQTVDISMRFTAQQSFDNARFKAFVEGYEHAPLQSSSEIFSVEDGTTYIKNFQIDLPDDMSSEKNYKLRITGANDLSGLTYKEYDLFVDTQRHRVDIDDLVMTPSSGVEPGQNLIANVRMKNRGKMSQESVEAVVRVPELGVEESSYISNLDSKEVATSDDMLLYIPEDASAKQYTMEAELNYNDGHASTTENYTLNVVAQKDSAEKNLVLSYKDSVDVSAGEENSFEVVVANPNENSKAISIASADNAWANVEVTPSLSMIEGGSDSAYTIKVTPKSGVEGEKELNLALKEGSETKSEFTVNTYVSPGEDQVNVANIVIAVLLVIAVIILLALVVTIIRRKGGREEEDDFSSTEEYY